MNCRACSARLVHSGDCWNCGVTAEFPESVATAEELEVDEASELAAAHEGVRAIMSFCGAPDTDGWGADRALEAIASATSGYASDPISILAGANSHILDDFQISIPFRSVCECLSSWGGLVIVEAFDLPYDAGTVREVVGVISSRFHTPDTLVDSIESVLLQSAVKFHVDRVARELAARFNCAVDSSGAHVDVSAKVEITVEVGGMACRCGQWPLGTKSSRRAS